MPEPSFDFKELELPLAIDFSYDVIVHTIEKLGWYEKVSELGGGIAVSLIVLQYVLLLLCSLYIIYKVISYLREHSQLQIRRIEVKELTLQSPLIKQIIDRRLVHLREQSVDANERNKDQLVLGLIRNKIEQLESDRDQLIEEEGTLLMKAAKAVGGANCQPAHQYEGG